MYNSLAFVKCYMYRQNYLWNAVMFIFDLEYAAFSYCHFLCTRLVQWTFSHWAAFFTMFCLMESTHSDHLWGDRLILMQIIQLCQHLQEMVSYVSERMHLLPFVSIVDRYVAQDLVACMISHNFCFRWVCVVFIQLLNYNCTYSNTIVIRSHLEIKGNVLLYFSFYNFRFSVWFNIFCGSPLLSITQQNEIAGVAAIEV